MRKFFSKASKCISTVCVFAILLAMVQVVSAENSADIINISALASSAAAKNHKYVYAEIGKSSVSHDEHSDLSVDSGWIYTSKGGKRAIYSPKSTALNLFLKPKSDYWVSAENSRAAITVEYFDSADASFSVMYASEESNGYASYGALVTSGSNTWKEVTYYLDDFTTNSSVRIRAFGWGIANGYNNGTYLGNIFIEEGATEHSIEVTPSNGYRGLIYGYGDEDEMTLSFDNNSGKNYSNVSANAIVFDHNGNVINTIKINSFSINAGSCVEKVINTGAVDCGIYRLELSVNASDNAGTGERYKKNIEFSVLRTSKNGKRHSMVGITANLEGGMQNDTLGAVSAAARIGIKNFKAVSYWDHTEVSEGVYRYNDSTMACQAYLTTNGVDTTYCATQIPSFYNDNNSNVYYTTDSDALTAYGNFVVDLVETTGTKAVEILNEINHSGFNANFSEMKYVGYAKYVKAAYQALHNSGHGDVKVIAGALAGTGDTSWVNKFKSNTSGIMNYCDAFSYHPYYYGGFDIYDFSNKIDSMHSATGKPIILSEIGWSSANDAATTAAGVPMYKKAAYIPEALIVAQSKGRSVLDSVYIYTLSEWGEDDSTRDYKFGILKSPPTKGATESFITLAAFCDFFADATIGRKISKNNMQTNAFEFTRSGKQNIAALWTMKNSDRIALNLGSGCTSINVYDMCGTPKGTMKSSSGVYTFNLTDEIVYIEGNFTSFAEGTPFITISNSNSEAVLCDDFSITVTDSQNRNLNIDLDYNREAMRISAPAKLSNGSAVLSGITGEKEGHYNIAVTLSDDSGNVYYMGNMTVDIDGSEYGNRSNSVADNSTVASYDDETRIATVAGKINNIGPNEKVTVLVSDSDNSENVGNIVYLGQMKLYDNNLFCRFKLPDEAEGTYTVRVCSDNFATPTILSSTKLLVEADDEASRISSVEGGIAYYNSATRVVTVNGSLADWKEKDNVTFMVTADGFTGTEFDKIRYIGQTKLVSATLNYRFIMPQNSSGHYNVYVCGNKFGEREVLGFNTSDTAYISGFTIGEDEGDITATAMVQNVFSQSKPVSVIIVQYDSNGRIIDVDSQDAAVPASTVNKTPCTCTVSRNANASKVMAYVWDSFEGLYPLASGVELN